MQIMGFNSTECHSAEEVSAADSAENEGPHSEELVDSEELVQNLCHDLAKSMSVV